MELAVEKNQSIPDRLEFILGYSYLGSEYILYYFNDKT